MSASQSFGSLAGPLEAGLETLSQNQTVTFIQYTKFILPVDGFVFWVRTGSVTATGSLHIAVSSRQQEDTSFGLNRVVFSTEQELTQFNSVAPTQLLVGLIAIGTEPPVRFAFGQRGDFFEQAGLYHYSGEAVYPTLATQLVDDQAQFDTMSPVVSNSLPIWLALNTRPMPVWTPSDWGPFPLLYPSFLVADNIVPPYIAVHIQDTYALQPVPTLDKTYNHAQLATETVRFTCYGMRNREALDFQDYLQQYSMDSDTDFFGLMDGPIMVDDKHTQLELSALGQKKVLEMRISYWQTRANDIARQLILSARVSYTVVPEPVF